MNKRSSYIFGAALAGLALGGVPGLVHHANAALVTNADFTFDTQTMTGTTTGGASFGSFTADVGMGTAYGVHAASAAAYSEPGGNGSIKSFSSNDWAIGDYYQFSVPTTGITGIQIAFDQIGSSSGPSQFSLLYSTDGISFSTFAGYSVVPAPTASGATFWNSTSSQTFYNHTYDLSGITGLNNDGSAVFLIEDTGTAAFSSSSVGTGGTDRVDNFVVSGTGSSVPEPAALSLLTAAASALLMRRRPQNKAE